MKKIAIAMLLLFGVSVAGGVSACPGEGHKTKTETSAPATPAPAPAK